MGQNGNFEVDLLSHSQPGDAELNSFALIRAEQLNLIDHHSVTP